MRLVAVAVMLAACGPVAPKVSGHPPVPVQPVDALEQDDPPAGPPSRTVWDDLADCESGDWLPGPEFVEGSATWDVVSPPHFGGLQFTLQSWEWVGGEGLPSDATRAEQIRRAEKLLDRQGWGAWPNCSRLIGVAP